jgi:EAL domain-containing protein (putative c-di-GMP-specific phosphodiesterase class I)
LLPIDTTGDSPLAPWSLFALAAGDATLRHLDRLCRTLHALNYFSHVDETQSLFLNVERRLLASVPSDHGKVFESILAQFNLSPRRIVIMFPRAIASDPSLLERAARNYRSRGYRVLVPASSWDDSTLRLFEELPVDLVKVDVVQGFRAERLAAFGAALRERGISLLASRVESAEMLTQVRETEVNLVQGFILGAPAPLPTVRRCQRSFLTHHTALQAALSGIYGPRARAAGMPTGT